MRGVLTSLFNCGAAFYNLFWGPGGTAGLVIASLVIINSAYFLFEQK